MAGPQRLYLFLVASRPEPPFTPAVCYLIQMSDGTNILIDSGIPSPPLPQLSMADLKPTVVEQLAELGLQPDDIDVLVCTHFDIDHVGMHPAFTRARRVIQRAHYEAAQTHERYTRWRNWWEAPVEQFQFVDGDTELEPGVELIDTSGHGPGHQSVLVRLPETGAVLLTIDAVPVEALFTPERDAFTMDVDPEQTLVSTKKLLEIASREQALVIFGHDGPQWATLTKAPGYYA